MNDNKLSFTANEQNCLARLCETMASMSHRIHTKGLEPTQEQYDEIAKILDTAPSINWSSLYDKFHRQGVNR